MALTVVTGPPCAGKSTWVRAQARPGDIVIDLDVLVEALSAPGSSVRSPGRYVSRVAGKARRAAVNAALDVCSRTQVYVIHSDPPTEALAQYARYDGRVVVVDPGRDVVMKRIAEQRPKHMATVAMRWYAHNHAGDSVTESNSRVW